MISPEQCRAARGWLRIEQKELAELVDCHRDTLRRFESGESNLRDETLANVRSALELRGISFTFKRDGEPLGIEDNR